MIDLSELGPKRFYAERDSRTNLSLRQPREPVALAVGVAPAWAHTVPGQLAVWWLASLVARMGERYNRLQLYLPGNTPNTPCLVRGIAGPSLASSLLAHLRHADPFGDYTVVENPPRDALTVIVGDGDEAAGIVVRPLGWAAALAGPGMLQPAAPDPDPANPVGAALAAAMGAAAVYFHCNRDRLEALGYELQSPTWLSAWERAATRSAEDAATWIAGPPVERIDLGRLLVVGAGALGGNLLAILAEILELQGEVAVVDQDRIDLSNLNRLLLAGALDWGQPKVPVMARSLAATAVRVVGYIERYERLRSLGQGPPVEGFARVISGVDQMATRAAIQSDWPRLFIDGGTIGYGCRVSTYPMRSDAACAGCLAGKAQQTYAGLGAPIACAANMPGRPATTGVAMDSYGFVSFLGAAFLAAETLRSVLAPDDLSVRALTTEAVALSVAGLRHATTRQDERCLCRCSHPVVQAYRGTKYVEGEV